MTRKFLTTLPLLLAGLPVAADTLGMPPPADAMNLAPPAGPIDLLPSGELTFPTTAVKNPPMFFRADSVTGVENVWMDADGQVELRRGPGVMTADHMHYTFADDTVKANGNVCLTQQGLNLTGPDLLMHLQPQTGTMNDATYTYHSPAPVTYSDEGKRSISFARGSASAINFTGQNQYQLDNATYTTCQPGDNDWYLRLRDLTLDTNSQIGTAHGATLQFKDTPILWTPWINFPLNDARRSGFLSPVIGTTGNSGASISLPWYWNIAPNYDATFNPTIISKRGLELGGEFRYLTPTMSGTIDGDILPDKLTGTTRWDSFIQHNETFADGVSGHITYQATSDNNFFRDLSNQLSFTSLVTLDQEAGASWTTPFGTGSVLVQQFQTLQDPNAPIIPPYARMPELTWVTDKPIAGGAEFNLYTDMTRFVHPTLVNGDRFVFNPSVSLPMMTDFGYITPKVGIDYTAYQLGANNTSSQSRYTRTLPVVSVDSGMYFDRNTNFFGHDYTQSLEPRLYYVYIPYQNQNQLPNFDTALLDPINYATLFTENRFVGYDRINDANELTMAVTSRFTDNATGLERLRVSLGQRFYFSPEQVTLPGIAPITSSSSDILADIGGQINEHWRAETAISYNTSSGQTDDESFIINYQPARGTVVNISYRSLAGQLNQFDISTEWPLSSRWYALLGYDYSLLDSSLVEGLAGVEYNAGCWAIRAVFQTIAIALNTTSTSFFIQLELNGLGNLGSNPLEALNLSIPGYVNSNELTPP